MAVNPVLAGDVFQVILEFNVVGQRCLNVLHYIVLSTPSPNEYGGFLTALRAEFTLAAANGIIDALRQAICTNVPFTSCTVQRVYPTRDYYQRQSYNFSGVYDDTCATANISAVITKQSEAAGRGRAGSFHLSGVPAIIVINGRLNDAYQDLLTTIGIKLETVLNVASTASPNLAPGMYHPGLGAGANFKRLIRTQAQATARVMRRRTVGVGI